MGKTSMLIDIALETSKKYKTVLFSLEMSTRSIIERCLANLAAVNLRNTKAGVLDDKGKVRLEAAKEELSKRDFWIDDVSKLSPKDLYDRLKGVNAECVLIDFAQLLRNDGRASNRAEELYIITQNIKAVAKHYGIPVVMAAQLNRQVEQEKGNIPRLSHLRASGGLEEVADVIWLLHRPSYYDMREVDVGVEDTGEAMVFVAKNRNGPVGKVPLVWLAEFMSFRQPEERNSIKRNISKSTEQRVVCVLSVARMVVLLLLMVSLFSVLACEVKK